MLVWGGGHLVSGYVRAGAQEWEGGGVAVKQGEGRVVGWAGLEWEVPEATTMCSSSRPRSAGKGDSKRRRARPKKLRPGRGWGRGSSGQGKDVDGCGQGGGAGAQEWEGGGVAGKHCEGAEGWGQGAWRGRHSGIRDNDETRT